MGELNWTAESERWLRDIHDYIAEDKPQAATRVVEGIYQRVQILRQFPELGHKYGGRADLNIGVLVYGHYWIAYLINLDIVENLGIFHGVLDIDRYLQQ